jgi:hypothetical protein
MKRWMRCWATVVALAVPAGATAQVQLTVRVLSQDAKLIGTGVGGARVTVRNAASRAVLATGEHQGGTGDTRRILDRTPRGVGIYHTDGAAVFTVAVPIDTPTVVEVEAEGPLGYPQARQRATATVLLVPGQDIVGDGLVLTLHGLIVELLDAGAVDDRGLPVRARIRMLCGCPFTAAGLWDAGRVTVVARVYDGPRVVAETALTFTGEENIWAGRLSSGPAAAGTRLVVLAADAERVNLGRSDERVLP